MQTAQLGGTGEVYHESEKSGEQFTKNKKLPKTEISRLRRLYHELAYCRMKRCQALTRPTNFRQQWIAFYAEECERLRWLIDSMIKPKKQAAPTGDVWRQMLSWVTPIIEAPAEAEEEEPW